MAKLYRQFPLVRQVTPQVVDDILRILEATVEIIPGVPSPVRFVSGTTNIIATDSAVVVDTTAGDVVVNLPQASPDLVQAGFAVYVKSTGGNRTQINPSGSALIDGSADAFYLYENDSALFRAGVNSWTALVLARRVEGLDGLITDVADLQGDVSDLQASAMPTGGVDGDLLVKQSSTDYDAQWQSELDKVALNTLAGVVAQEGELCWNAAEGTLDVGLNGGAVILQVGQELHYRVVNMTGSTIPDGTLCMAAGTVGNSGKIKVKPWDGSGPSKYIMGIAAESIANGANGYVTAFGKIRGIQTNGANYGETWVDGEVVYAKPAGGLTKTIPTAPNPKTTVAIVVSAHATNGELFVRPTYGSSLGEDELVQLAGLADGDILQYDNTDGRFENRTPDTAGLVTKAGAQTISGQKTFSTKPILPEHTPTASTDTGVAGEWCWDEDYVYVCVAADTWKRAALTTW